MVDSFKNIDEYADLENLTTTIILTPGAHFSAANPIYYYNRLLELKTVVYEFKEKYPNVQIIFKTTNYFPGDFSEQFATISGYNSKRLEKIAKTVFDDSSKVEIIDLYDRTEILFDEFARTARGIHPGLDGGSQWVLNGIVESVFELL